MFKVCVMILELIIWSMMISMECVIKLGVKDITISVLIWLKNEKEGKYRIFIENKTKFNECNPKSDAFYKHMTPNQTKTLIYVTLKNIPWFTQILHIHRWVEFLI